MTKKTISKVMFILILCITIAFVIPTSIVLAKYIKTIKSDYSQISSPKFYFTSNLLDEVEKEYLQVSDDINNEKIIFVLNNYKDELNYSNSDINYTIRYWLLSKPANVKTLTGTILKVDNSSNSNTITLNVSELTPSNSEDTVCVEVSTTSPYEKTLKAKFAIKKIVEITEMKVTDKINANNATVVLTIGNKSGTVIITAPVGYIPDPMLDGYNVNINARTISFTTESFASYTFTFVKENSTTEVTSGFSCTIDSEEVSVVYE